MCTDTKKITVNGIDYKIKCGKCWTCRRERSQEWAIKLINEFKYHKKACFITLTFDSNILTDKNSKAVKKYKARPNFVWDINNSKEYFKKFMKRLRKHYSDTKITFYHIGEHGELKHRAHHHVILYGINFEEDRKEIEKSKSGKTQYHSDTLYKIWACGRISIQDLNPSNIAYISMYSLKKFKNNNLNKKYRTIQSFSNRSKMNTKWIRKYPREILKLFIKDNENKKYRIPKSYINNIKNDEKLNFLYEEYLDKIEKYLNKSTDEERIERQKAKENIYKSMTEHKKRDF